MIDKTEPPATHTSSIAPEIFNFTSGRGLPTVPPKAFTVFVAGTVAPAIEKPKHVLLPQEIVQAEGVPLIFAPHGALTKSLPLACEITVLLSTPVNSN